MVGSIGKTATADLLRHWRNRLITKAQKRCAQSVVLPSATSDGLVYSSQHTPLDSHSLASLDIPS